MQLGIIKTNCDAVEWRRKEEEEKVVALQSSSASENVKLIFINAFTPAVVGCMHLNVLPRHIADKSMKLFVQM